MASQPDSHLEWIKGSPVEVYSNGLAKWCPGEIVGVTTDNEGTCLELRYWDGAVSKAKYLDPKSPHVRKVENPQNETRYTWKKNSEMECWSNSRAQWFGARIVGLKEEKDGEWLQLSWEVEENGVHSTMTKEVLRTSLFIRPKYGRSEENDEIHPVSVEVMSVDPGAEEDQDIPEGDEVNNISFEEQPGALPANIERYATLTARDIEIGMLREAGEDDGFEDDDWELEREEYEFKFDELQNELKRCKEDMDDKLFEKDNDIDRLTQENAALSQNISDLEALVQQMKEMPRETVVSESVAEQSKPAQLEHLSEEIDRLNRELLVSQQKCAESAVKLESHAKQLHEKAQSLKDTEDELKDLTAAFKTQIKNLEYDNKKYQKQLQSERQRRLSASSRLEETTKTLTSQNSALTHKLKKARRVNSKMQDGITKLRQAVQKPDDGSTADPALRPPIRRSRLQRKSSRGDQSPSTSTDSRSVKSEIFEAVTMLESIMSNVSYSDEEDTYASGVRGSLENGFSRPRSRPQTPQQHRSRPNGYGRHRPTMSDTFEPAEVPRGHYHCGPFSARSEPPGTYHILPEEHDQDPPGPQLIPGIGKSRPYSPNSFSSEQFFDPATEVFHHSTDSTEFVPPTRPRDRSSATYASMGDQRKSIEIRNDPGLSLNGHQRDESHSMSTDYSQNGSSTPATVISHPSPVRRVSSDRLSVTSPVPNTTVATNEIIDTVNVKWPRRKKSLVLNRNRHYETTRVSLRDDGMQIEHYGGAKGEPKFWRWDQVSSVSRDHAQLIVSFGETEYIKMKLSSPDLAQSWLDLLQQRRQQST